MSRSCSASPSAFPVSLGDQRYHTVEVAVVWPEAVGLPGRLCLMLHRCSGFRWVLRRCSLVRHWCSRISTRLMLALSCGELFHLAPRAVFEVSLGEGLPP